MMRLFASRYFVFLATAQLLSFSIASETAMGQQVSAIEGGEAPTWYRQRFHVGGFNRQKVELLVNTAGTTSVYVNGQILVKDHAAEKRPLLWDVTQLLRNGQNCLSVSVSSGSAKATVSAVFRSDKDLKTKMAPWKSTVAMPPVGWEQTDFNDRDWKPSVVVQQEFSREEPVSLNWRRLAGESHLLNGAFRFRENDHVILLGGTFIERAQQFGHLESALIAGAEGKRVTFRNLGWSADTVFADSRGIFDSPQRGYDRMIEQVRAEKPTVIMVCYGQNEAMGFGELDEGQVRFMNQLAVLHRDLASTGAQIVLLSPHPFLQTAHPLPDASGWNDRLRTFSNTVQEFARANELPFIDLFSEFQSALVAIDSLHEMKSSGTDRQAATSPGRSEAWSDNGMHWNGTGYRIVASVVSNRLFGDSLQPPTIDIDTTKKSVTSESGDIKNIRWGANDDRLLSFDYRPTKLSPLPLRLKTQSQSRIAFFATAKISDAGKPVSFGDCKYDTSGPDGNAVCIAAMAPQYEQLRQLTMKKNELYFHRWRPQNITYLFGFRKNEQGNNASEIAKFDPLIDKLEQQIFEVAQPAWQTITLSTQD